MSTSISFDNINLTKNFQRAYYNSQRILPPIEPQIRKEMEEEPASVIIKFVGNLSNELKRETDENIRYSEIYTQRVKTEPNLPLIKEKKEEKKENEVQNEKNL